MVRGRWFRLGALLAALAATACSSGGPSNSPAASGTVGVAPQTPSASPTPTPIPPPPYAIAALRARPHTPGTITVGPVTATGTGWTKHDITWTSGGSTMTGIVDIPDGAGPFPVVIVNHGYVAVSQYYAGEDSAKYADPMASAGFLTISPNYPGYVGSGPGEPGVPSLIAEAISDIDLISSLDKLTQADPSRVAVAGHSNGGGVALILMVADPRVRAAVLYAPVSSDMTDNARKWWIHHPETNAGLPDPDADPAPYLLMSPRLHFSKETPPALVMQGTADEQIPAAWTAATVDALQKAGARTQFVSFPDARHIFAGADLDRANALAIQWLRDSAG